MTGAHNGVRRRARIAELDFRHNSRVGISDAERQAEYEAMGNDSVPVANEAADL
jgi:hypothetical protein